MRIKTGILGFDELTQGGIEENSVCVIVGGSGTGKTLFCLQFLLSGLINKEKGIYFTLEQKPDNILKEAENIGWPELRYYTEKEDLVFYPIEPENFEEFISSALKLLENRLKKYKIKTRIVVDPITPVLWEIENKSKQRKVINRLFNILRKLGTSFVSVEQHTIVSDNLIENDVSVPVFLSDAAVLLRYLGLGGEYDRSFRIIKIQTASHGVKNYPLEIIPGLGVVIFSEDIEDEIKEEKEIVQMAIKLVEKKGNELQKQILLPRLKMVRRHWKKYSSRAIEKLLKYHGFS